MGRILRGAMASALALAIPTALVPVASAADDAEVRRLAAKFVAMIQTHKATPLTEIGEMLSDDFIQYGSDGSITKGREANLQGYRQAIQKTKAAFQLLAVNFAPLYVRVSGESAVAIGHVQMKGELRDGGRPFTRAHRITLVFWRTSGKWKLLHKHSSIAHAK